MSNEQPHRDKNNRQPTSISDLALMGDQEDSLEDEVPASGVSAPEGAAPDPGLDALAQLRLDQDFAAAVGLGSQLLTVPMRRPDKTWFIRVHPKHYFDTFVLEDGSDIYAVAKQVAERCPDEVVARRLYLAVNTQKTYFLWPVKLPNADGSLDDWNLSAHEIADQARRTWVTVRSKRDMGAYICRPAPGITHEPEWPGESFDDIVKIATKGKVITGWDHPKLRQRRGEVL